MQRINKLYLFVYIYNGSHENIRIILQKKHQPWTEFNGSYWISLSAIQKGSFNKKTKNTRKRMLEKGHPHNANLFSEAFHRIRKLLRTSKEFESFDTHKVGMAILTSS